MSFYKELPTFTVETANKHHLFPEELSATQKYQNYVDQNIPCELYKDGWKQKEYKP